VLGGSARFHTLSGVLACLAESEGWIGMDSLPKKHRQQQDTEAENVGKAAARAEVARESTDH
jgi:hypothetical protein